MLRRRRRTPEAPADGIDLAALDPRWRRAVEETVASRARLRALVEEGRAGPVQERLATLVARADAGVLAAWNIATRAQAASRTLAAMDLERVSDQLKTARRRLARVEQDPGGAATLETEVRLLAEQHAALNQLSNAVEDAAERLRLLDLRLDAAVARTAQITLRPDAVEQLGGVDAELGAVVDELNALRAGLDAVGPPSGS
jgi:hypothetical protein